MARIVRRETRRRGFFGWLFLVLFIVFNVGMAAWLFTYWGLLAQTELDGSGDTLSAQKVGLAIGGTIGSGVLLFFWVAGAIILGLLALLTRGSKVLVEEDEDRHGVRADIDMTKWSRRDREAYLKANPARQEPALTHRLPAGPSVLPQQLYEPTYEEDAYFSDLKNEISVAAKQALARAKSAGFEIKARPDAILLSRDGEVETLRSNSLIIARIEQLGL